MRLKRFVLMLWALPLLAACTAKARLDLSGHEGEAPRSSEQVQPQAPAAGYPDEAPVARQDRAAYDASGRKRSTLGWKAQQPGSSALSSNQVIVVREGDTLYSIARQHNVTVAQLFSVNGLVSDQLKPGQHIVIPAKTQ
ncbi:MAG: LysM peptidoglycan-binding domain-containing protein [Filomicrobium sp.]